MISQMTFNRTPKIMAIIVALTITSCATTQDYNLDSARWLIGTWENRTSKGVAFESWLQSSDSEFGGRSYMVNGNDTTVMEVMRLVKEGNSVYYIPVVADQNNGMPVRFVAMTLNDTLLHVENLEHDFPQYIEYRRIGPDSLRAEIWGSTSGKVVRQSFPMKRTSSR